MLTLLSLFVYDSLQREVAVLVSLQQFDMNRFIVEDLHVFMRMRTRMVFWNHPGIANLSRVLNKLVEHN